MRVLLLAASLMLIAYQANAADTGFFFKPTIGADYQYTNVDYTTAADAVLNDSLHGANIHVGARVHRNLGFEAGYSWTADADRTVGIKRSVNVQGFNFDALGYLPVDDGGKFELIATAGVTNLKGKVTGTTSTSDTETKFRAGGGAQFWIMPNLNVRGLVRYQDADFNGIAKSAIVADAGLNWQF